MLIDPVGQHAAPHSGDHLRPASDVYEISLGGTVVYPAVDEGRPWAQRHPRVRHADREVRWIQVRAAGGGRSPPKVPVSAVAVSAANATIVTICERMMRDHLLVEDCGHRRPPHVRGR